MIIISNSDRDQAVNLLRAYAKAVATNTPTNSAEANRRRLSLKLAAKLEAKKPQ
jgi:folate-dependent phosphoribosylglycinamide formyltransferase PurN